MSDFQSKFKVYWVNKSSQTFRTYVRASSKANAKSQVRRSNKGEFAGVVSVFRVTEQNVIAGQEN